MANIMDLIKLGNNVSKQGFDLSRKNLFTAKIGELLPVAYTECIPGDYFEIDTAWFTRTQPVNTAAYTRMREYYDFYFVPTNLLWNKFNTFVTQMVDNNTKASGINTNTVLSDEHPYFTTHQVWTHLYRTSEAAKVNMFGFDRSSLSAKLLQYLDYGDYYNTNALFPESESRLPAVNAKLNPFPLLAYQKIYQDFFRNSQWEKAYSPACNIDYMSGAAGTNNIPLSELDIENDNMFDLRYCNWNKDYFMGLLPRSQYGPESLVESVGDWHSIIDSTTGNKVDGSYAVGTSIEAVLNGPAGNLLGSTTVPNTSLRSISSFSILALRQAESLQKWREITQSQQQDYKSQIQAHFGEDVPEAYSDRCSYLGGVSGNLDIQPVQNTNLTGDADANLAGRGEGGNRGKINFRTKVHGYLMCIYHAVPLLDFSLNGIPRVNLKSFATDYAIPEFDKAGMVPVHEIELINDDNADSNILGYAPRYIDYKTAYDLVHGGFYAPHSEFEGLQSWVAPIDRTYILRYLDSRLVNKLDYVFFKVPPSVVNPIFGVDADSSPATDHLLVNCSFSIKAVRKLDKNGLPY